MTGRSGEGASDSRVSGAHTLDTMKLGLRHTTSTCLWVVVVPRVELAARNTVVVMGPLTHWSMLWTLAVTCQCHAECK